MPLYHVSPIDHAIGAVIRPGRFGQQFLNHGAQPNATYCWEVALEAARLACGAGPSRLNCLFAFETMENAIAFRAGNEQRAGAAIFEVSYADATPRHRGDFDLLTGVGEWIGFMPNRAAQYWTQPPVGTVEVLVGGPITILRRAQEQVNA